MFENCLSLLDIFLRYFHPNFTRYGHLINTEISFKYYLKFQRILVAILHHTLQDRKMYNPPNQDQNTVRTVVETAKDSASKKQTCSCDVEKPSSLKGLNFSTLDEFINREFQDLLEEETVFLHQAMEVNARTKLIMMNQNKLSCLQQYLEEMTSCMDYFDNCLEFVRCQHRELEHLLKPLCNLYEKMDLVDICRYPIYYMAEKMDCELKHLYLELIDLITEVNADTGDLRAHPMGQLATILNIHFYTLNSIESRIKVLEQELCSAEFLKQCYCNMQQHLKHTYGIHIV